MGTGELPWKGWGVTLRRFDFEYEGVTSVRRWMKYWGGGGTLRSTGIPCGGEQQYSQSPHGYGDQDKLRLGGSLGWSADLTLRVYDHEEVF